MNQLGWPKWPHVWKQIRTFHNQSKHPVAAILVGLWLGWVSAICC